MLNDYNRNLLYQKAIQNAVHSGYRSVLDIGTGTGILRFVETSCYKYWHVYLQSNNDLRFSDIFQWAKFSKKLPDGNHVALH